MELDALAVAKVEATKPKQSDIRMAFKNQVVDGPGGQYTADLKTRADIDLFREMRRPYASASLELNQKMNAAVPTIAAINPRGEPVTLPASQEAVIGKKGFHSRISGRRRRLALEYDPHAPLKSMSQLLGVE